VLQGPGENAGVLDIGGGWATAFKIESHNHPSYIEPFQGAATGVGGILRDIFTMGARPLAVMDSLRFGSIAPETGAKSGPDKSGPDKSGPDESGTDEEERKLIDTIAERLAHFLMQRRLQATLSNWQSAMDNLASPEKREWWVIIEFLRKTDQQLLMRISRRMLNYLCWNGIDEAQQLLQRFAADFAPETDGFEDNIPVRRKSISSTGAEFGRADRSLEISPRSELVRRSISLRRISAWARARLAWIA